MANWVLNKLEIYKSDDEKGFESIKNIFQAKKNTDCEVFDSIIGKNWDYNKDDWYDHNNEFYGTKWDVYFDQFHRFDMDDNSILLWFDTANSPPREFVYHLCEDYLVNAKLIYCEGADDYAGCYLVHGRSVFNDEHDYRTGIYLYDREAFWDQAEDECPRMEDIDKDFVNTVRSLVTEQEIRLLEGWIRKAKIKRLLTIND